MLKTFDTFVEFDLFLQFVDLMKFFELDVSTNQTYIVYFQFLQSLTVKMLNIRTLFSTLNYMG